MKEQYVGDVNDYRKFALLRRLGAADLRIGVCWMLTPPDARNDGRKTGYLDNPEMARFDPELFNALQPIASAATPRRLPLIEQGSILPDATFFDQHVPTDVKSRADWIIAALAHLAHTDLIFFDPDNGLDVPSIPKGRASSPKFVYRDEIAATYAAGHSILIYQHFPREARDKYLARLGADLAVLAAGARMSVFKTPHVAFLFVVHPKHDAMFASARITDGWDAGFMQQAELVGNDK